MKDQKQQKQSKPKNKRVIAYVKIAKAAAIMLFVVSLLYFEPPTLTLENAAWMAALATLILAVYEWVK